MNAREHHALPTMPLGQHCVHENTAASSSLSLVKETWLSGDRRSRPDPFSPDEKLEREEQSRKVLRGVTTREDPTEPPPRFSHPQGRG